MRRPLAGNAGGLGAIAERWTAAWITLSGAAVFLVVGCLSSEVGMSLPQTRPNIVLIVTDDQDAASAVVMPRTRRFLANEGMTFRNAFVPIAICCPARMSILRGQYPHNHGVRDNAPPNGGLARARQLGLETSTLATWLQAAGYRTALLGKYLNGYTDLSASYIPPGWDEWYAFFGPGGEEVAYFNYTINANGTYTFRGSDYEDDYATDVLAGLVVDVIRRVAPDSQPFFLYITPFAPHEPPLLASRYRGAFSGVRAPRPLSFDEEDVSDKAADVRNRPQLSASELEYIDFLYPRRLGMLLSVDDMVAGIVDALQASGDLDRTFIFLTSDNGFHMGHHRFPPGKGRVYQEDIRVPLMVRGPGVPYGSALDHMIVSIDLAPTIAELARASVPSYVDGRSFVPLLFGSTGIEWRKGFLVSSPLPVAAIRTEDYIYAEYAAGERELYDLRIDPYELRSMHATASPALLASLTSWLQLLRACAGVSCRTAENGSPTR